MSEPSDKDRKERVFRAVMLGQMAGSATFLAERYLLRIDVETALGKPVRFEEDWPDAKVVKLESIFDAKVAPADHMLIDITPGHGKFEGKAVLTLHFGTLFLSGLLA